MGITDEEVGLIIQKISRKVSRERKKRGISMSHLADMANLSVSHISKMENAQCEIGLRALLKIAAAFDMNPADFLSWDQKRESDKEKVLSNGERFESLTQGSDPQAVDFILKMTEYLVNPLGKNVSYKKRKKDNLFPQANEKGYPIQYNVLL